MIQTLSSIRVLTLAAGLTLSLPVSQVRALVIEGESGGVVSSIDLSAAATLSATVAFGVLDETSPPPYNESLTSINLASSASSLLLNLYSQSGTGSLFADSDVDAVSLSSRTVSALASIEDLSFSVGSFLFPPPPLPPLVSITMGNNILSASAEVQGSTAGDITVTGDSDLLGLQISISGAPALDLSAFIDGSGKATPNTQILSGVTGIAGLTITLNEQTDLGDNDTTFGRRVSAIHLNFDDVESGWIIPGDLVFNGDVYLSQAYALATIPEPSTGALALAATLLGLSRRRRHRPSA